MSGLSAIIRLDGGAVSDETARRCDAAAAHRGPAVERRVEGSLALAYLGETDEQTPRVLVDACGGALALVLAGQLYNRDALRRDLGTAAGTDAALVLAAYRRWGMEFVSRLDGDFAFVLHDAARAAVVCARDALGMHPLCYALTGQLLLVASEPRQILAAGVASVPCEESIAAYMATARHLYGGENTFYRDIRRVEAGHLLEVRGGTARVHRHWQLDPDRRIEERTSRDMAEKVRALMIDAVARRVPQRGPYACALTGGFDSSSVAALYARALPADGGRSPRLETFSFELRDLESDEPDLIDAVSSDLGTHHHHIYLDRDNVFAVLPQMLHACDEPTFDMGLLYLWRKKERAAHEGVKVMLSGLGGDELFVGQFHFLADLLRRLELAELWREMKGIYPIDRYTGRRTSLTKLLRAYVVGPLVPRGAKRLARGALFGERLVPPWVDAGLARRVDLADRIKAGPPRIYRDGYRQDCYEVFQSSLVDVTLPLHEQLGAAFGIETRFPLLDRRLVEYLFAAPRDQKIRHGEVRGLQRRAMEGILPEVVLRRHVKKNLNPVLRRQQQQNFVAALEALFARPHLRCEQYMDGGYLRRMYKAFVDEGGGNDAALPLWYAMNLEPWLEGLDS